MPVHGKNAVVLAHGVNLTSFLNKVSLDQLAEMHDSTCFGKNSKEYTPGLFDAKLSGAGLFDSRGIDGAGVAAIEKALSDELAATSDQIWTYLPEGDAFGASSMVLQGIESSVAVESPEDGLVSIKAEVGVGGVAAGGGTRRPMHGTVFMPLAGRSGAGIVSTVRDDGASSANGAAMWWQVTALNLAAGDYTLQLQHSADNITYADLLAILVSPTLSLGGFLRITAAQTVNRYLRVRLTTTGSSDPTIEVCAARL